MAVESGTLPGCSSVQEASNLIRKNLHQDREFDDLTNKLCVNSIYTGVCSGMQDEDYPIVPVPISDVVNLPLLTDVRRVPLPPELIEQFSHMQCNCIIGIFPEIGRAWLTVDSDIFVWKYAEGDDVAYFDGLAETILSVALVAPRAGIFREHVKYLLILTTPLDIIILGVSFAENDINNEMHLLPDPLFTLSLDNMYLHHTVGTETGRIFTGGKDGCLYEIVYRATGGWFNKKCIKVNHSRSRLSFLLPPLVNQWMSDEDAIAQISVDDTRHILYTLSEKGTITVFDLGEDGLATSCAGQLPLENIQRKAKAIASGIEPSNLNQVVYISPITLRESRYMHLVAVTQSGIRLYFVTCQIPLQNATTVDRGKSRPTGLYLVHVRLPPGFTNSSVQRPTSVHAAFHNAGSLLLASTNDEDALLWYVNSDMYAFDRILKENQCNFALDGRSWAISEVPYPCSPLSAAALPDGVTSLPPDPPTHVIQHIQRPPEYVVITPQGCHLFNKLRPVDQLRSLLETIPDPDSPAIDAFFKIYKNGEAAVCCIILATSCIATDRHIADRATTVFLQHTGINTDSFLPPPPQFAPNPQPFSPLPSGASRFGASVFSPIGSGTTSVRHNPAPMYSTPMPGQNPLTAQQPFQANASNIQNPGNGQLLQNSSDSVYYSERQQGVYKMFARVVRPLWEGKLVTDQLMSEAGKQRTFVMSRVDLEVVGLVLDQLINLKTFVKQYCLSPIAVKDSHHQWKENQRGFSRSFAHQNRGDGISAAQMEQQKKFIAEATAAELTFLTQLDELANRAIQVLGLWRIILHHQIHVLYETLDKQIQTSLKMASFQDLVLNGQLICSALVSALVSQYIGDHSTVDALSSQLREICPDLYSPDDVVCSKATELLNIARTSMSPKRSEQLQEALTLLQRVSHSVNLPVMVQQFQAVRFYTGVVELAMKAAENRDRDGLAIRLYHSPYGVNDPATDPQLRKAFLARTECYKCITDMLDDLMVAAESHPHPQSPSVPVEPGPPKLHSTSSSSSGAATLNSLYTALPPEEAQQHAEECLQLLLRSKDELLHITMYEWMLRKNMSEELLHVTSPFLEPFLQRIFDNQDDCAPGLGNLATDLLWRYFERNSKHGQASAVLAQLAEKPGSDRKLDERIELLSRAKMNAKSMTSATANVNKSQKLHELEEKLEVSAIQRRTLLQLRSMGQHQAVARLDSRLYNITALYSEFADPNQLAEIKLAIVHCAGLRDQALIEALWLNVIEFELAKPSNRADPADLPNKLRQKLIDMAQEYANTELYFPLYYLIVTLENISCNRGWELNFVYNTFLACDMPIFHLLVAYNKIHLKKSEGWNSMGHPNRLIWVQACLISDWLEDPDKFSPTGNYKRHFITRSLDIIAGCLVQLHTANQDVHTQKLTSLLKRTQARIENLQTRVRY